MYNISISNNIVTVNLYGVIMIDTIKNYYAEVYKILKERDDIKGVISSYEEAKLSVSINETLELISNFLSKVTNIKLALVLNASSVAIPMFVKEKFDLINVMFFSSYAAALDFMNA